MSKKTSNSATAKPMTGKAAARIQSAGAKQQNAGKGSFATRAQRAAAKGSGKAARP